MVGFRGNIEYERARSWEKAGDRAHCQCGMDTMSFAFWPNAISVVSHTSAAESTFITSFHSLPPKTEPTEPTEPTSDGEAEEERKNPGRDPIWAIQTERKDITKCYVIRFGVGRVGGRGGEGEGEYVAGCCLPSACCCWLTDSQIEDQRIC